jgi:hypothetical protein
MFFKKQYGNVGIFILPMASFSIVSILFVSTISVVNIIKALVNEYVKISTIGFNFSWSSFNFDWFYVNTEIIALIGVIVALGTITMILASKRMSENGKLDIGMDLIYYLSLYMFIAPIWIGKALWNAVFQVKTNWR